MRSLLGHVSKSRLEYVSTIATGNSISRAGSALGHQVTRPWICQQCRHRSQNLSPGGKSETTRLRPGDMILNTRATWGIYHSKLKTRRASSSAQGSSPASDAKDALYTARKDLPSQEEGRRSHISKRLSHLMDHLQSNIFIAGQRLNDLTGYSGIEALKKDIEDQEKLVQTTRNALHEAKEAYSTAITQRSTSQREVNELLQRKHAWSSQDLERFTSLYRSDHANEQSEAAAQEALASAERRAEEAAAKLSASILARYHEEQIWSDKIRRMSTWGTWGLMGMNVLLFLVFQIGVEPWRRKRLVKGFEEKVMEALEREGAATNAATGAALAALQAGQALQLQGGIQETSQIPATVDPEAIAAVEEVVSEETGAEHDLLPPDASIASNEVSATLPPLSTFEAYKESFRELFSERQIVVRRVDYTTAALQGAAVGAGLVGIIVALLRQK